MIGERIAMIIDLSKNKLESLREIVLQAYLWTSLMTAIILTGCVSCKKPIECVSCQKITPISLYLLVSPLNEDGTKVARVTLSMIGGESDSTTRLVTSSSFYRIAVACEAKDALMLLPGVPLSGDSEEKRSSILASTKRFLNEKKGGCNSNPEALTDVMIKVNSIESGGEDNIVLIIQAPWAESEISSGLLNRLSSINFQLAKKKKVKKILLFGVNPNAASKLSKAFEIFNKTGAVIFESPATDDAQLKEKLKQIRKGQDALKQP